MVHLTSTLFKKIENGILNQSYLIWVFGVIISFGIFTSCSEPGKESNESEDGDNPALAAQVEDLNNVLPQRLDQNTTFDSVGLSLNQLHYYYSISNLTQGEYEERQLHDSLYAEAIHRIPCTLWRPVFMQGVEVSFTYFSSGGEELLHLERDQQECGQ